MKNRHIPQRTCVGCRETKAKQELIRIVRAPSGGVEIDLSGKKPGRGAYFCHNPECWEKAIKRNRLDYTLRTKLSSEDRQLLAEYSQELVKGDSI